MPDFRESATARRQSWYGAKKYAKRLMALRLPHAVMQQTLRVAPSLRSSRLPAPAHVKEVVGVAAGRDFVMLRPDRCEIAKELYWGHGRRPSPADDFAIQFFAEVSKSADVVFDVGAYTGIFTLVAVTANQNAYVHAFEVIPEVYKALFDNCVRNDILPNVTLHHAGVGEDDRVAVFPVGTEGSALPSFYSASLTFQTGVRVGFRSLDSLGALTKPGNKVLMKIDVEGTEDVVIGHGTRFLKAALPDMLCEVLPDVSHPESLVHVLKPLGYNFFLVTDTGLAARADIIPDNQFRDWFFTVKPHDQLPLVQAADGQ